MRMHIHTLQ